MITRLVALSDGGTIPVSALDAGDNVERAATAVQGSFRAQVEALERELLRKALHEAGGNQSEAARRLSLSRATFLDKLKRHGL